MLLFADGFDAYGATADFLKKGWINSAPTFYTWNATAGRFGAGGLAVGNGAGQLITPIFNPTLAGYSGYAHCAFWLKVSAIPSATLAFIQFGPISSQAMGRLQIANPTGQLSAYSNTAVTTAGPNICDGQWHWIEAQWLINTLTNAGTHKVALDGTIIFSGGPFGQSVGSPLQIFSFNMAALGITMAIDDLMIWDDQVGLQTGELVTASFPIGAKKIETYWPTGAGTNTNFTPLTGANYSQVNEIVPDRDTSYISSTVSGTRDSYNFGSPVQGLNPLVAIINVHGENSDAGNINYQGLAYNGSSFGLGDSKVAPNAYATTQFPIFRDPNTSAAWTKAGINTAQFGVGVV